MAAPIQGTIMLRLIRFFCICTCLFSFVATQASSLEKITVINPKGEEQAIYYDTINGYAVVEGDILLGKVANLKHHGAVITPKLGGFHWPNGIVPYELDEDLPFMSKLSTLQAIDHWQQNSKLVFIERTSKNRQNYPDYIIFTPAQGTTCSSFVGMKKGKQEINLAPRCNSMHIVHEIGHALGLWHEQSRADRDMYVRIVWENIEEHYQYNFMQHLTDGVDFGEYDYQSIMHYGPYSFSKNGEKTIVPLIDGVEIGQRNQLSPKDKAVIFAFYSGE